MTTKILCVVGTRPEAIKMAPVIIALKQQNWVSLRILATAQHRNLLDQVLSFFGIVPDIDLDVMYHNQTLASLTSRLLSDIDQVLDTEKPHIVLTQGDTTTAMTVALACFYHQIPLGHIEAGLRTWDKHNPFPEEINRVITGRLANWHFAPTERARQNLLREGTTDSHIIVTGNTVIDALLIAAKKKPQLSITLNTTKRMILVTSHRRENFGDPFKNICRAINALANANQDIEILFPVHPNPNIKDIAHELLANCSNIILCEPLDYGDFIAAMQQAYFIISDSGGIQEEAPALGKPVLVLRDETERPEAVEQGVVKLVGSDYSTIIENAQQLLDDTSAYYSMVNGLSPYGNGKSAEKIVAVLKDHIVS